MHSVQLVARRIKPQCVIHDFVHSVQLVARRIKPQCVIHDFMCSVQLVARRIKPQCVIYDFMCSVHLDARLNHVRNVILTLSGIHDFVQQVARYDSMPVLVLNTLPTRKAKHGFW